MARKDRVTFSAEQQTHLQELINEKYLKAYAKAEAKYSNEVRELRDENDRLRGELEQAKKPFWRR